MGQILYPGLQLPLIRESQRNMLRITLCDPILGYDPIWHEFSTECQELLEDVAWLGGLLGGISFL